MFYLTKNKTGLTLLETTIALGILMIGILASITLMLSSFNYIQATEDEIVVVNLAREGLEIMRSVRNNNSNPPVGQTKIDIFSGSYDNQSYVVDSSVNATLSPGNYLFGVTNISQCSGGTNTACTLYLTPAGRYTHDPTGNERTSFSRLIIIAPSPDYSYEKIITSTVSWQTKNKISTFSLETRLTDWQTQ